jgi:hypothetical protein
MTATIPMPGQPVPLSPEADRPGPDNSGRVVSGQTGQTILVSDPVERQARLKSAFKRLHPGKRDWAVTLVSSPSWTPGEILTANPEPVRQKTIFVDEAMAKGYASEMQRRADLGKPQRVLEVRKASPSEVEGEDRRISARDLRYRLESKSATATPFGAR